MIEKVEKVLKEENDFPKKVRCSCIGLSLFGLGVGVKLTPLGQKNSHFKMALDTFQLLDEFRIEYKGQFLAKSGGQKYFFRAFTDVKF